MEPWTLMNTTKILVNKIKEIGRQKAHLSTTKKNRAKNKDRIDEINKRHQVVTKI